MRATVLSRGSSELNCCLWAVMPAVRLAICENQRSGRLPPPIALITAPNPAADGKTGSQMAVGAPSMPLAWKPRLRRTACRRS